MTYPAVEMLVVGGGVGEGGEEESFTTRGVLLIIFVIGVNHTLTWTRLPYTNLTQGITY